jgi:acetyl esterase/lipase
MSVRAECGEDVPYISKSHAVKLIENVPFGVAGVGYVAGRETNRFRRLMLDIYEPQGCFDGLRPALVLAFGGAYQRGTRKDDQVKDDRGQNTAIAEYCREFAKRGYVCFSIDYRLMPEAPDPGFTPVNLPDVVFNVDRANIVRGLLGLEPCTQQMMSEAVEAATDDMVMAVSYVRSRWRDLTIDPNCIAVGGFSAGAANAINAVYCEKVKAVAVLAISGRLSIESARRYIQRSADHAPLFMTFGEHDLPGTLQDLEAKRDYFAEIELPHAVVTVSGAGHFYPINSRVNVGGQNSTLEAEMARFLKRYLGK